MIEVLIALVGVLNVAVGALAWQLRRNGKNNGNNNALQDVLKLLYSIDGKIGTSLTNDERAATEVARWHEELRRHNTEIIRALGDVPKRGEA